MEELKLILIVGPTASGKTAASIYAAIKLNGEIVSADSIQVYKGMDIGSAKPTMQERQGIPHHLMDAIDINSPKFSVAEFRKMAGEAIEDIAGRGKQPIVVGGTGLYINSLVFPLNFTEVQFTAAQHLINLGHKNIVYAAGRRPGIGCPAAPK